MPSPVKQCALSSLSLDTSPEVEAMAQREAQLAKREEQVYELESALAHQEAGHVQRAEELQAATEAADAQFALTLASRTAEDEERLRLTCATAREQVMAELREEERARLEALNPVADKSYAASLAGSCSQALPREADERPFVMQPNRRLQKSSAPPPQWTAGGCDRHARETPTLTFGKGKGRATGPSRMHGANVAEEYDVSSDDTPYTSEDEPRTQTRRCECNCLADGECEDSSEFKAGAADAEAACEEREAPTNDGRDDARETIVRHTKASHETHEDARDDAREATVRHTKASHDTLDARTQKKVVVGDELDALLGRAKKTRKKKARSPNAADEPGWKPCAADRVKAMGKCAVFSARSVAETMILGAAEMARSVIALLMVLTLLAATSGSASAVSAFDTISTAVEQSSWQDGLTLTTASAVMMQSPSVVNVIKRARGVCLAIPWVALKLLATATRMLALGIAWALTQMLVVVRMPKAAFLLLIIMAQQAAGAPARDGTYVASADALNMMVGPAMHQM